jgi:hypothetical protein
MQLNSIQRELLYPKYQIEILAASLVGFFSDESWKGSYARHHTEAALKSNNAAR